MCIAGNETGVDQCGFVIAWVLGCIPLDILLSVLSFAEEIGCKNTPPPHTHTLVILNVNPIHLLAFLFKHGKYKIMM
jgi:hypothetical protein